MLSLAMTEALMTHPKGIINDPVPIPPLLVPPLHAFAQTNAAAPHPPVYQIPPYFSSRPQLYDTLPIPFICALFFSTPHTHNTNHIYLVFCQMIWTPLTTKYH